MEERNFAQDDTERLNTHSITHCLLLIESIRTDKNLQGTYYKELTAQVAWLNRSALWSKSRNPRGDPYATPMADGFPDSGSRRKKAGRGCGKIEKEPVEDVKERIIIRPQR